MSKIKNFYRLNDVYFKSLLGDKRRKNLTLNFLNSVLKRSADDQFVDIDFDDKQMLPDKHREKVPELDIVGTTDDGTKINIEVQVGEQDFYGSRAVYYWAKLHGRQMLSGDEYEMLRPTIAIHLLDFIYFDDDDRYHRSFHVRDDENNVILSNDLELHFVELKKFTFKDIRELRGADTWYAYFSKNCTDDERNVVAMSNPLIKEAINYEAMFAKDDGLRRQYEALEKARRDRNAVLNSAVRRGEERGEERGIAKAIRSNIINGLKSGIDVKIIAQITKADIDTINKIKQELKL